MLRLERRSFEVRGRTVTHEFVRFPQVVVVLARDPGGCLLFVRQYRAALDRRVVELPAGRVEPGEAPAAAAIRELEEETGYRADAVEPLVSFWPAPGYSDECIWVFQASGLRRTQTAFDPGEDIELVRWEDARWEEALRTGELRDGKTILALLAWRAGLRVPAPGG